MRMVSRDRALRRQTLLRELGGDARFEALGFREIVGAAEAQMGFRQAAAIEGLGITAMTPDGGVEVPECVGEPAKAEIRQAAVVIDAVELRCERQRMIVSLDRAQVLAEVMQRGTARSEERRVGKECRTVCRSRWSPYH